MGIGAYQAREYVRSLGGDVEVQRVPVPARTWFPRSLLPLEVTGRDPADRRGSRKT